MTSRLSPLGVTMLALVAWALWLGVLTGRVEALLIAVPLLVGLVRSGTRMATPRYSITHEASTARLFEGESVTVTVTVTAASALRQVEILEPLPASVEVVSGSNRMVLALEPGETARFTYEIRVPAWLHLTLGTLQIRIWELSGLRAIETRYHDPKSVRVYPRPAPLRRLPAPLRTQSSVGNYVSAVVGEGLEPGEIRPFAPGDRVRHVNWRASLRLGRLHVTRHQEERNADVVLMLDTLSRAGSGTASTLQAAVRAAASLAGAYLHQKDRVGLIEYGGVFRWVKPGTGRAQLERVLDTLLRADVTFTYVAKDLGLVPRRVLPSQALVIAVSPLLDARFIEAASDLAARGFDLVVLAIDPIPFARASMRPSPLGDVAARLWALERSLELAALRGRGLRVLEWDPEGSLDLALARLEPHRRRWTAA